MLELMFKPLMPLGSGVFLWEKKMIDEMLGFWGLFISAFISSTIMPGGSEAILAYMVSEKLFNVEALVLVATIGNTLGALTTWFLGILAAKKFPAEELLSKKNKKSLELVKKWGVCWPIAKFLVSPKSTRSIADTRFSTDNLLLMEKKNSNPFFSWLSKPPRKTPTKFHGPAGPNP